MSNRLTGIKGLFCGGRDGRMGEIEDFSWIGMKSGEEVKWCGK